MMSFNISNMAGDYSSVCAQKKIQIRYYNIFTNIAQPFVQFQKPSSTNILLANMSSNCDKWVSTRVSYQQKCTHLFTTEKTTYDI